MSRKELITKELQELYNEGAAIAVAFGDNEKINFHYKYQAWYTKTLKAIQTLAPDRYLEFRGYYEVNSKRKGLDYESYVIQDFMKSIVPTQISNFDDRGQVLRCFVNQLTIFKSIEERVNSLLGNIEDELYAELQDSEVIIAKQLIKVSPRAAGALMGVVIEGHLQKIAVKHGIKVAKKNPTISDLNDPLKNASIIDTPTWRKITYLADIRNLCSHKKDEEPTIE